MHDYINRTTRLFGWSSASTVARLSTAFVAHTYRLRGVNIKLTPGNRLCGSIHMVGRKWGDVAGLTNYLFVMNYDRTAYLAHFISVAVGGAVLCHGCA